MSIGAFDWFKLHCGDRVHLRDDPRHVGRVEAIHSTGQIKIKWHDTGWISFHDRDELQRLKPWEYP